MPPKTIYLFTTLLTELMCSGESCILKIQKLTLNEHADDKEKYSLVPAFMRM